jgi:hypothetical protein
LNGVSKRPSFTVPQLAVVGARPTNRVREGGGCCCRRGIGFSSCSRRPFRPPPSFSWPRTRSACCSTHFRALDDGVRAQGRERRWCRPGYPLGRAGGDRGKTARDRPLAVRARRRIGSPSGLPCLDRTLWA